MSYFENYTGGDDTDDDKKSIASSSNSDESDIEKGDSDFEENENEGVEDIEEQKSDNEDEVDEEDAENDADNDAENDADIEEGLVAEEPKSDDDEVAETKKKKSKKIPSRQKTQAIVYDEEDDEDPTGEEYLQKFDREINDNYLVNVHPESAVQNYDEILAMSKVVRNKNGIIIDDLHKTIPYLTKYEKARVLGLRAKQINSGASVFISVPEKVIDGYLIAELELQEKRIPFIIRRPLPNGGSEYWSIKDLENISF
jgi:DNA-directed RNA polymerase I, II, and III subunit RPABC2